MKIYVGNLSYNTGEAQLQELFAPLGQVTSVNLIIDQTTGRSRGFGFVEMSDDEGRAACEALDQREYEGRRLTVNEAKPQERRSGGYGGGGGNGGRPRRDARW